MSLPEARRFIGGCSLLCPISAGEAKEVPGKCKGNWEHVAISHESAGRL